MKTAKLVWLNAAFIAVVARIAGSDKGRVAHVDAGDLADQRPDAEADREQVEHRLDDARQHRGQRAAVDQRVALDQAAGTRAASSRWRSRVQPPAVGDPCDRDADQTKTSRYTPCADARSHADAVPRLSERHSATPCASGSAEAIEADSVGQLDSSAKKVPENMYIGISTNRKSALIFASER